MGWRWGVRLLVGCRVGGCGQERSGVREVGLKKLSKDEWNRVWSV